MLIERIPSWGVLIVFILYLFLVALAIVGGYFGPQVWDSDTTSAWICPEKATEFNPTECFGSDFGGGLCDRKIIINFSNTLKHRKFMDWNNYRFK